MENGAEVESELLDKPNNQLIKGYELDNNATFTNNNATATSFHNNRMRLTRLREYNRSGKYKPYYKFEYDYNFERSKASYKAWSGTTDVLNTWAKNPGPQVFVDRTLYGDPACWISNLNTPYASYVGFFTEDEYVDSTTENYFCLTKITFPSGGSETYSYERHDYSHISGSEDEPYMNYNNTVMSLMGRRISRKTVEDDNGNSQTVDYIYGLHDSNYNFIQVGVSKKPKSSGILVNPSIHTSAMYKPMHDVNGWQSRFVAIPYTTDKPQNSLPGSPVYYTEVEEVIRSGAAGALLGRKVYYFREQISRPAMNYVYTNYNYEGGRDNWLVPIPNTLYGKQSHYTGDMSPQNDVNYTYMAYPVGEFFQSDVTKGHVLKEVTLDGQGNVARIVENRYQGVAGQTQFGLNVHRFNDTSTQNASFEAYRYMISQTFKDFSFYRLQESIVTDYLPSGTNNPSVTEQQSFSYTQDGRILSTTLSLNNNETLVTENLYPDNITFATQSNLSVHAGAIKNMIAYNMIGSPVQTVTKKENKYIGGTYTAFKQEGNDIVPDTVFVLESGLETSIIRPSVNSQGKMVRHGNFKGETALKHDGVNPIETYSRTDDRRITYKWGYNNRFIIAEIENYSSEDLSGNFGLLTQLNILDDYTVITSSNRTNFNSCNQAIRTALPDTALITTYTYNPLVGITSETDPRGVTTFYEYDSFGRLRYIKNHNFQVIREYRYNYGGN